ncbi:hypothetical protein AB0J84_22205 [Micromonospora arborensis]|uniref:hypothetical protein n=1 Tax=Micromonospora arborensis TaxID=2116518 RepID=UPI003418A838
MTIPLLVAALLGVPGPAQAAPEQAAPAAAPDNAVGKITHTLTPKTPDPPPATRAAPADDVLTLRTELYERARLLANPSTAPFDTAASSIITLGEPGWYRIRAHCRGRVEAGSRVGRGELYYHGVEEWLMQMWPVAR